MTHHEAPDPRVPIDPARMAATLIDLLPHLPKPAPWKAYLAGFVRDAALGYREATGGDGVVVGSDDYLELSRLAASFAMAVAPPTFTTEDHRTFRDTLTLYACGCRSLAPFDEVVAMWIDRGDAAAA
ncbi:MAG: hypothetical protein AB7T63_14920 [Planctomycetota bacterium]